MKLYYANNQEAFFKTEGNIILFWILVTSVIFSCFLASAFSMGPGTTEITCDQLKSEPHL
jgi:hypothetical protein